LLRKGLKRAGKERAEQIGLIISDFLTIMGKTAGDGAVRRLPSGGASL